MTTLVDFTSADEIRAILGVSSEELEDATILLGLYFKNLEFELSDISLTLESQYVTIKAQSTKTALEQKFLDVASVFAAYSVSRSLVSSVGLFAPRKITDGRAETERVVDPFSEVKIGVLAGYGAIRARLILALAAIGTAVTAGPARTYFTAAGLAVNPVTGV